MVVVFIFSLEAQFASLSSIVKSHVSVLCGENIG